MLVSSSSSSESSSSDGEGENITRNNKGQERNAEKSKVQMQQLIDLRRSERINKSTSTSKTLTDYFRKVEQTRKENELLELHQNCLPSSLSSSSSLSPSLFNFNVQSSRSSLIHRTTNYNNNLGSIQQRKVSEVKDQKNKEQENELQEQQEEEEYRYTRECKRTLHPSLVHQIALNYSYVSWQHHYQQHSKQIIYKNKSNNTSRKRKKYNSLEENSVPFTTSTHSIPVHILHLSNDPFVPLPHSHHNTISDDTHNEICHSTIRPLRRMSLLLSSGAQLRLPLMPCDGSASNTCKFHHTPTYNENRGSSSCLNNSKENNSKYKTNRQSHGTCNVGHETQGIAHSHLLESQKKPKEEEEEELEEECLEKSAMFMSNSQKEAGHTVNDNCLHKIYWKVAEPMNSVLHSQSQESQTLHNDACHYNHDDHNNNANMEQSKIKMEINQQWVEYGNNNNNGGGGGGGVDMVDLFIGDLPTLECMCVSNECKLTISSFVNKHPALLTLNTTLTSSSSTDTEFTRNKKKNNGDQEHKSSNKKVEREEEYEEQSWHSLFTKKMSELQKPTMLHIRFHTLPYKLIWLDCITFNSFRDRLVVSLPCEERIVTLHAPHDHPQGKLHKESLNERSATKVHKNNKNNQSQWTHSLNQSEEQPSSSLELMEQEFPVVQDANYVNSQHHVAPSASSSSSVNNVEQSLSQMTKTESLTEIADIEIVSSFSLHRGTIPLDVVEIPHLPFIAIGTYEHGVLIVKLDVCTAALLHTVRTLDLSGVKAGLYPITALAAIAPPLDCYNTTWQRANTLNATTKKHFFSWEHDAHDLLNLSHVSLLCSSILEPCMTMIKCAGGAHGVMEDFPSIANWTETMTCMASHVNIRPSHNKFEQNYKNNNNSDSSFMERKRVRPSLWEHYEQQQQKYHSWERHSSSRCHRKQSEEEEEEEEEEEKEKEEEVGVLIALGDRHLLRYTAHIASTQQYHHLNAENKFHELNNTKSNKVCNNVDNNSNTTKRMVADAATQLAVHRQTMWWCGTGMIVAMAPGPLIYQQAHPSSNYSRVFAYPRHWLVCVDVNNTIYLLDRAATVYSTHSSLTLQRCATDNTIEQEEEKEEGCCSANEKKNCVNRTRCIGTLNAQKRSSSKLSVRNKTNAKEYSSQTSMAGSSKCVNTKPSDIHNTNTTMDSTNTRSKKTDQSKTVSNNKRNLNTDRSNAIKADNSEVTRVNQVTSGVVILAAGDGWLCACVAHHQNCLSVIYWGE